MTESVSEVERAASVIVATAGQASAAGSIAGDAAKFAGGAMSALLTEFAPGIAGVFGAVVLGLGITVFWDHRVTIPGLEAQAAIDTAALGVANGQTAAANLTIDQLRSAIQQLNDRVAAAQKSAADTAQLAAAAGKLAALKALPKPPADKSAAGVNAYVRSLRAVP